MCKHLVLAFIVAAVAAAAQGATEGGDFSHGLQILGKIARQYINTQPEDLKLGEGVHLISTRSENDARANTDDGSVLGAVQNYLESHEVRIKLPELMPGEGFGRAFKETMEGFEANSAGTPRGKGDKGGMGGIMIMGLMMGKMMAALGLGGVGLLAMKALMVSALALMLSMIIGLKKLVSSDHEESGHTVIHASHGHDHHRKKREATDMAYQAWREYQSS